MPELGSFEKLAFREEDLLTCQPFGTKLDDQRQRRDHSGIGVGKVHCRHQKCWVPISSNNGTTTAAIRSPSIGGVVAQSARAPSTKTTQPRPAGSATTTPNLLLPLGPALQWRSRHKWCGPRGQSQSFPIGFQVKAATEATTPDRVCVTAWCSLCASASGGSDVKLEASSANDKV